MASFTHEGLALAYDDLQPQGANRTLVLVHGFASNRAEGWRRTGWYDALQRRGFRVVALDQRGHGESAKPHEPTAYGRAHLAGDVLALMDHLGVERAAVVGYSMGARVAYAAAAAAPERVTDLILGGVGERLIRPDGEPQRQGTMAEAMRAADPESLADPLLRSFRQFADEQGEDREALAACAEGGAAGPLDPDALWSLRAPVLVVAGQRDRLAGDPQPLADAFPAGRAVAIPGCDHFSAIPHALTKAAVVDFLDGVLEPEDDPFARRF